MPFYTEQIEYVPNDNALAVMLNLAFWWDKSFLIFNII